MTEVQELIEAAEGVLAAMDKYNEANGTYLGGGPLFRLARAVGALRTPRQLDAEAVAQSHFHKEETNEL